MTAKINAVMEFLSLPKMSKSLAETFPSAFNVMSNVLLPYGASQMSMSVF